ncbi:hypothetical protein CYJ32_06870 [Alloscardovia omnicolens]|uniref:Response regulatory domain-containing protein n=1 Tax=Alloscardovia omnicolens TaxID=419015 RepID=A0A2I1M3G1_9BIFI|nr:LytTR family DNA-binding domain-containing protein [Alloscardovia omnicolens]MDU6533463.1 LytTR family DNA-binding domain-containing protein [Alloscardovia omnicolens]MDU6640601.1 LytTR family DNA-binding domain-containing protein [Alloscardovia omnicolens]PKZ14649.1 hypothetical protein CYJ32_06870 [Alloscardovia omnicolens]
MNIVIVDDDDIDAHATHEMIERFFASYSEEPVDYSVLRFTNGDDFLENNSEAPHIVFMDVEMPGTQGVDVARKLREFDTNAVLVFTTKMAQYAAEGYDVDAIGYLVKPFTQEAFDMKMRKALTVVQQAQRRTLSVMVDGGLHFLQAQDIEYIDVARHKVTYHMTDYEVDVWSSLKEVLQLLNDADVSDAFSQINRYTIVNLARVSAVEGDDVVVGKWKLGMSRGRKKPFMLALAQYHGQVR